MSVFQHYLHEPFPHRHALLFVGAQAAVAPVATQLLYTRGMSTLAFDSSACQHLPQGLTPCPCCFSWCLAPHGWGWARRWAHGEPVALHPFQRVPASAMRPDFLSLLQEPSQPCVPADRDTEKALLTSPDQQEVAMSR